MPQSRGVKIEVINTGTELLLGNTLASSDATSVGLANFKRNTRISVSASALLSIALMISVRCRMFACVSVMTMG